MEKLFYYVISNMFNWNTFVYFLIFLINSLFMFMFNLNIFVYLLNFLINSLFMLIILSEYFPFYLQYFFMFVIIYIVLYLLLKLCNFYFAGHNGRVYLFMIINEFA